MPTYSEMERFVQGPVTASSRRPPGRADVELEGHLQAANLGKRSADVPIQQERKL